MSLQSTDQIADLITRIRNAIKVSKNEILVPTSKLKAGVVEVLGVVAGVSFSPHPKKQTVSAKAMSKMPIFFIFDFLLKQ